MRFASLFLSQLEPFRLETSYQTDACNDFKLVGTETVGSSDHCSYPSIAQGRIRGCEEGFCQYCQQSDLNVIRSNLQFHAGDECFYRLGRTVRWRETILSLTSSTWKIRPDCLNCTTTRVFIISSKAILFSRHAHYDKTASCFVVQPLKQGI